MWHEVSHTPVDVPTPMHTWATPTGPGGLSKTDMKLEEGHVEGGREGLRGGDRRLIGTCFIVQMKAFSGTQENRNKTARKAASSEKERHCQ